MAPPEAKANPSGVQVEQVQQYSYTATVTATNPVAVLNYILRFVALALTLVAAIVLGVAKQTKIIALTNGYLVPVTVKAINASAFKYFVAANVIAFVYSIASLVLSILSRGAQRNLAVVLALADVVTVALLFSGNGAAAAISIVAKDGMGVLWSSVCGVYGKVCDQLTASIVLSMIAALAYVLLVVLFVVSTRKT